MNLARDMRWPVKMPHSPKEDQVHVERGLVQREKHAGQTLRLLGGQSAEGALKGQQRSEVEERRDRLEPRTDDHHEQGERGERVVDRFQQLVHRQRPRQVERAIANYVERPHERNLAGSRRGVLEELESARQSGSRTRRQVVDPTHQ